MQSKCMTDMTTANHRIFKPTVLYHAFKANDKQAETTNILTSTMDATISGMQSVLPYYMSQPANVSFSYATPMHCPLYTASWLQSCQNVHPQPNILSNPLYMMYQYANLLPWLSLSQEQRKNGDLKSCITHGTMKKKRYQCPWCQTNCSNSGQLRDHLRIHTGERPYQCGYCGRRFTRNEELTRHKRIHTNERPFLCEICAKRFGRRDHLNKHAKTHINGKRARRKIFEPCSSSIKLDCKGRICNLVK